MDHALIVGSDPEVGGLVVAYSLVGQVVTEQLGRDELGRGEVLVGRVNKR